MSRLASILQHVSGPARTMPSTAAARAEEPVQIAAGGVRHGIWLSDDWQQLQRQSGLGDQSTPGSRVHGTLWPENDNDLDELLMLLANVKTWRIRVQIGDLIDNEIFVPAGVVWSQNDIEEGTINVTLPRPDEGRRVPYGFTVSANASKTVMEEYQPTEPLEGEDDPGPPYDRIKSILSEGFTVAVLPLPEPPALAFPSVRIMGAISGDAPRPGMVPSIRASLRRTYQEDDFSSDQQDFDVEETEVVAEDSSAAEGPGATDDDALFFGIQLRTRAVGEDGAPEDYLVEISAHEWWGADEW
jgi:hypothetical protein